METIMVVDDESSIRTIVRQMLEREGYSVLDAPDGTEATDLCLTNQSRDAVGSNCT